MWLSACVTARDVAFGLSDRARAVQSVGAPPYAELPSRRELLVVRAAGAGRAAGVGFAPLSCVFVARKTR